MRCVCFVVSVWNYEMVDDGKNEKKINFLFIMLLVIVFWEVKLMNYFSGLVLVNLCESY